MQGETIEVLSRTPAGVDEGNNTIWQETSETVHNVLVAPYSTTDKDGSTRIDGVEVVFELHFPKTYTKSLRGARVRIRNLQPFTVVGDPQPYTDANTPGRWNRPVKVGRTDG